MRLREVAELAEKRTDAKKRDWWGIVARRSGFARLNPVVRRALLLGIAAGLAIFLVVFVPAYVATQPGFFARYPHLASRVETWRTSVHANVGCQECHAQPGFFPQTAFAARMVGELYLSLLPTSRTPDVFPPPTNAACQQCHIELRAVSPSGDLNIPHRAHVEVLKLQCVRCHKFLVHELSPEGSHHPRMIACLNCHDGRQAKNSCSTCHTQKAAPPSHAAKDWVIVHPTMQGKIDCAKCHGWTANWCQECHSRRPRSHDAKWRTNHPVAVKTHRDCEVCHTADFCIRCHGTVPKLNFNPALRLVR